ncbi:hypothetical protein ACIQKB_36035 [Streptomyces sp. NPDC092046]|uniref:hypothetical protein n=1 Tax=Streptomyces sp. NPDC092046 TaxID=3366009 RepID=UPI003804F758
MNGNDLLLALAVGTALRVFGPDVRALTRRLLTAGVRIGATELLTEAREGSALTAPTAAVLPPASPRGEE